MAAGRKTGGRQRGTPNKCTASVRAALEECFERIGGIEILAQWAQENQTEFYRIWSKILPRDLRIEADIEHTMTLEELVCGSYHDKTKEDIDEN